ncbi:MAG: histidine kinase dimerization/phosphoacceptor domain -containing protein [Deltaproteobacteria bacterium]
MNFNIFQWRSLKTKMTLFTLTIFLISIWSLVFYVSRMLREDMQRLLGEHQFSTVSLLAGQVNQELDERLRALETIAGSFSSVISDNTSALQTHLEYHPIFQSLFNGGTYITGIDGTTIASIPLSAGRIGVNYMERDHIAAALKEGKFRISQPVIGKMLHAPVFGMAAPIRDTQGKVIGALAGVIDLSKPNFLDEITENHYGKSGGYVLLIPQYRLIVTATDKSRIMEKLPAPGINPTLDRFIQGYEGSAVYTNPLGVEVLGSARQLSVSGWLMEVTLPTEEAFAPIRAMQQRMLLATIFVTLLVGGLAWWMLRHLLSPMLAAARTLATLSDTDQPPQPLPITSQDEIGELIGGLNRLLKTLAQREDELKRSERLYRLLTENIKDVVWILDTETMYFRYVSPSLKRLRGYTPEEILTEPMINVLTPEAGEYLTNLIHSRVEDFLSGKEPSDKFYINEVEQPCKDGSTVWTEVITSYDINPENGRVELRGVTRDITERKGARAYREMGLEVLQILNEPGNLKDSIQRVIAVLKSRTGFDAVGIRLQDGEDFPYLAQDGFSEDFLLTENTLIEHSADGEVCRNKDGNVKLECTCGLVISGKTDPVNPLFTPGGSFWTNDSFPLLDIPSGDDPRLHPRNQCIHQGYASFALVPIRNQDRIVGLIQLNDRRKGCFTRDTVELMEGITSHIGAALMRKRAEEALRENQHFIDQILNTTPNLIYIYDLIEKRNLYANLEVSHFLGYSPEKILAFGASLFPNILHADDAPRVQEHHTRFATAIDGDILQLEYRMKHASGEWRWLHSRDVLFARNAQGVAQQILGSTEDITDRKKNEDALRASLEEKKVLLKEVHHRVKNNLAAIMGLIDLQGRKMVDEPARAAMTELSNRIRSMSLVHEMLYQSENFARIDFQDYLNSLTAHLHSSYHRSGNIHVSVAADGVKMDLESAIPCGLLITELVTNAFKYAFPAGQLRTVALRCEIAVSAEWDGATYTLAVADNGVGLPADLDWMKTKTLGLVLVKMLGQHQLQGKIEVDCTDGTTFRLRFAPPTVYEY